MRFKRSSTLSLLLFAAITFVGYSLVRLWQEPLTAPPVITKKPVATGPARIRQPRLKPRPLSIATTVEKNLFDPMRGSGNGQATEASSVNLKAAQDFVLLGTMITSAVRQAIIRVPPSLAGSDRESNVPGRVGGERGRSQLRRVDLGDNLGGFELAEVDPGKVVLLKGSDRIELVLDFTRHTEETKVAPKPAAKTQTPPRKNQPRRAHRGSRRG